MLTKGNKSEFYCHINGLQGLEPFEKKRVKRESLRLDSLD